MRFRPCIDIHNGRVKQIVGGSINDAKSEGPKENYVSDRGADYYASLYSEKDLKGGHIILLNKVGTPEYEASRAEAMKGLAAYPGGMQIGGGITPENAMEFIEAGASHIIVTSYIFEDVKLEYNKLEKLVNTVGRDKLVLDLSCRYRNGSYYIVTNRWQTFTDYTVTPDTIKVLSEYCDEFLIHGVDVEGMRQGIDERLIDLISETDGVKITYAGGVKSLDDIKKIRDIGRGRIDVTVGSALKMFGGVLSIDDILSVVK